MFISPAYAQAAGSSDPMAAIQNFAPLILIFVVFYFLLIRPQQKKMKEHKAMLEAVRRGDKIVTNGGIIGVVTKIIDERELQLEIAENVRVRVLRDMIASVMAKTEPAPADKKGDGKDDDKSNAKNA